MRYLALSLILAMSFSLASFSLAQEAGRVDDLEAKLSQLKNERQALEKQIQALESKLHKTQVQAQSLQQHIQALNYQISTLEIKIKKTNNQIQASRLIVQELDQDIARTTQAIHQQLTNLQEVLRALYLVQQVSPLELLLTSANFGEFFQNKQYLTTLQLRLSHLLRQLKTRRLDLQQAQASRQQQLSQLIIFQEQLDAQQLALEQQRRLKQNVLQQTKGEERRYQQFLSQLEAKKAQVLAEIRKLEQEISRRQSFLKFSQASQVPPPGTKLFINPLDKQGVLTQGYGMTYFAKRGIYGGAPHNGIDLAAGAGTPIKAAAPGLIFASGYNEAWGNWVALQHPSGLVTLYAHMLKPTLLRVGEHVNQGRVIGYVGSTGFSTGAHLHFSLYQKFFTFQKNGDLWFNYFEGTLNPLDYLK